MEQITAAPCRCKIVGYVAVPHVGRLSSRQCGEIAALSVYALLEDQKPLGEFLDCHILYPQKVKFATLKASALSQVIATVFTRVITVIQGEDSTYEVVKIFPWIPFQLKRWNHLAELQFGSDLACQNIHLRLVKQIRAALLLLATVLVPRTPEIKVARSNAKRIQRVIDQKYHLLPLPRFIYLTWLIDFKAGDVQPEHGSVTGDYAYRGVLIGGQFPDIKPSFNWLSIHRINSTSTAVLSSKARAVLKLTRLILSRALCATWLGDLPGQIGAGDGSVRVQERMRQNGCNIPYKVSKFNKQRH